MRDVSTFFAVFATSIASTTAAAPPEMKPIETFVEENIRSTNGSTEVFVGLRCYSLMRLMAIYTEENNMLEDSRRFSGASDIFLMVAQESQIPKDKAYLISQIRIMISAYRDRFLEAKARTGNFSDDPVIRQDMAFCSELAKND